MEKNEKLSKKGNSSAEKNTNITISINPTVISIGLFSIAVVAVLLIAVLALQEYVVSVCILIVLEAAMAALLHKAELWKHGILVILQLIAAAVIQRMPLVALCIVVYVAAIVALQFMSRLELE